MNTSFNNDYFHADEKSVALKQSLYIPINREPLIGPSNFKETASFKQFLNGSFDYPRINMFEFSSNEKMVYVDNILFINNDPVEVKRLFKQFFNRCLLMENNPIGDDGLTNEEWRKDIIKAQCNHSFVKQLPKYPYDDLWHYVYMNVQC